MTERWPTCLRSDRAAMPAWLRLLQHHLWHQLDGGAQPQEGVCGHHKTRSPCTRDNPYLQLVQLAARRLHNDQTSWMVARCSIHHT